MKSRLYGHVWTESFRKSKGFFTMQQEKLIHVGKKLFGKSRAWFQTGRSEINKKQILEGQCLLGRAKGFFTMKEVTLKKKIE